MELLRLLRVIRRRWPILVMAALVGAGVGVASAKFGSEITARGKYYRATNTLTSDRDALSQSQFGSLGQVALLAWAGDAPKTAAQKLGLDAQTLTQQVTITTNNALGTLSITAISTDPTEAARIATTFSDTLISTLSTRLQKAYDAK